MTIKNFITGLLLMLFVFLTITTQAQQIEPVYFKVFKMEAYENVNGERILIKAIETDNNYISIKEDSIFIDSFIQGLPIELKVVNTVFNEENKYLQSYCLWGEKKASVFITNFEVIIFKIGTRSVVYYVKRLYAAN